MGDKRRQENPYISLFKWAQLCNCSKNCGEKHIPVFTGLPTLPVWPLIEDFCKSQLIIYSKGTWKKVKDLKEGYNSYIEAFAVILNSVDCPDTVKEMITRAQEQYDKKVNKKRKGKEISEEIDNDNIEFEDSFSEESDTELLPESALNIRKSLILQKMIMQDLNNGEIERNENFATI